MSVSPSTDPLAPIRGVYEALADGNAAGAAALYAEDAVNHGRVVGRAGMQRVFEGLLAVFGGLRFEIQDSVASGDRVVCRIVMTGTHVGRTADATVFQGALAGVAPTGRRVEVLQYHEFRLAGDLIAEHRAVRDDLGMLRQLGLLPAADP